MSVKPAAKPVAKRFALTRTLPIFLLGVWLGLAGAGEAGAQADGRTPHGPEPVGIAPASESVLIPPVEAGAQVLAQEKVWAQDKSDVEPDRSVVYGRLDNGFRYALRPDRRSGFHVSMRLQFAVGARDETPGKLGAAHFIEHLAFDGSDNVRPGDFLKKLELAGLALGPDANAFTTREHTIYKLDAPKNDVETVDFMLLLLRETAGRLSFLPEQVERERTVVLSELRLRDSPAQRFANVRYALLNKGVANADWPVIGTPATLQAITRDDLVQFYHAHYRPERAFLVVTGNFDAPSLEKKIKAQFDDWSGVGPAARAPDLGGPSPAVFEAAAAFEPGAAADTISLTFLRPEGEEPDTLALRRRRRVEDVAIAVLSLRLAEASRRTQAPFLSGLAFDEDVEGAAGMTIVGGTHPGDWATALAALEHERRRLLLFGLGAAELKRVVDQRRTEYERLADEPEGGAVAADRLAAAIGRERVFATRRFALDGFDQAVNGLTPERVVAAARDLTTGRRARVFVGTAGAALSPSEAARIYRQATTDTLQPPANAPAASFDYQFAPAGKVKSQRVVKEIATTLVEFENGLKLNVRPMANIAERVFVRVRFGSGADALGRNGVLTGVLAPYAWLEGGLGRLDAVDLERSLAGKDFRTRWVYDDDHFVVDMDAAPRDFALAMQVLAARFADPGFRTDRTRQILGSIDAVYRQFDNSAPARLGVELLSFLASGDGRYRLPSLEAARKITPEEIADFWKPLVAHEPLEITIVGDISVEAALAATADSLGALPARPALPVATPVPRRFPEGGAVGRFFHGGRADQSVGAMVWPAEGAENPILLQQMKVLAAVMQDKASDVLRGHLGATYVPGSIGLFSEKADDYGFLGLSIETTPEKLEVFFDAATSIAQMLAASAISDEDLTRAKAPLLARLTQAQASPQFWLAQLADVQTNPDRVSRINAEPALLRTVTAADVQNAAARFLTAAKAVRLIVSPRPAGGQP